MAGAEIPHVIAVVGVKGGVGATLVAVGLAGELADLSSPCVVDLDLYKGDVAGLLNLETPRPLSKVTDMIDELDAEGLRGCAARHDSGVAIIGQPFALEEASAPSRAEVAAFLRLAREAWRPVFVDCGSRADPQTLQTCLDADAVLLVCTPDLLALRDLNRVATLLTHQGVPRSRLGVVLNCVGRDPGVDPDEVSALAHLPVLARVRRDDPAARAAVHDGRPPSTAAPNSRLAADLLEAWTALSGERVAPSARPTWWRRLLSRASAPAPT